MRCTCREPRYRWQRPSDREPGVVQVRARPPSSLTPAGRMLQANSTSIFFVSASSFAILKLRIWPWLRGSGFAEAAGALPFQRSLSIDERLDRSTFASGFAVGATVGLAALTAV